MSTDELMDERLLAAGERWRAGHTTAAATDDATDATGRPDSADIPPQPARSRRPHYVVIGTSAAAILALLIGLGYVLFSGGSGGHQRAADPSSIQNVEWSLRSVDGTAVADPLVTMTISGGTIVYSDGDGVHRASVSVGAHLIRPGTFVSVPGGQSKAYTEKISDLFGAPVTWSLDNGVLTLSRKGAATLVYGPSRRAESVTDPAALPGSTWLLDRVASGGTGAPASGAELSFDRTGRVTINEDAGLTYAFPVTIGRGVLTIAGAPDPDHPCTTQKQVNTVLGGRVSWLIKDGSLTITKAHTVLKFVRISIKSNGADLC